VRELWRTFHRVERDEWIAFFAIVEWIERAAFVQMHPREKNPQEVWAAYAEFAAGNLASAIRRAYPQEARSVTVAMVRGALDAAYKPKKGAPKWEEFVPIAKAIIGEDDPDAIRVEIARVRRRQPR
jgi:hypothetical protein